MAEAYKTYDRQGIIDALNEGQVDKQIALKFGCDRATVNLVKNNAKRYLRAFPSATDPEFARRMNCSVESAKLLRGNLENGLLASKRGRPTEPIGIEDDPKPGRGRSTVAVVKPKRNGNGHGLPRTYEELETLLDGKREQCEAVITLIKQAREQSAELERIRPLARGYINWKEAKEGEDKKEQEKKSAKWAYESELRQGNINPPVDVAGGKNKPNFTEHIYLVPIDTDSLHNINLLSSDNCKPAHNIIDTFILPNVTFIADTIFATA